MCHLFLSRIFFAFCFSEYLPTFSVKSYDPLEFNSEGSTWEPGHGHLEVNFHRQSGMECIDRSEWGWGRGDGIVAKWLEWLSGWVFRVDEWVSVLVLEWLVVEWLVVQCLRSWVLEWFSVCWLSAWVFEWLSGCWLSVWVVEWLVVNRWVGKRVRGEQGKEDSCSLQISWLLVSILWWMRGEGVHFESYPQ